MPAVLPVTVRCTSKDPSVPLVGVRSLLRSSNNSVSDIDDRCTWTVMVLIRHLLARFVSLL